MAGRAASAVLLARAAPVTVTVKANPSTPDCDNWGPTVVVWLRLHAGSRRCEQGAKS
jgi:hypothetical protein